MKSVILTIAIGVLIYVKSEVTDCPGYRESCKLQSTRFILQTTFLCPFDKLMNLVTKSAPSRDEIAGCEHMHALIKDIANIDDERQRPNCLEKSDSSCYCLNNLLKTGQCIEKEYPCDQKCIGKNHKFCFEMSKTLSRTVIGCSPKDYVEKNGELRLNGDCLNARGLFKEMSEINSTVKCSEESVAQMWECYSRCDEAEGRKFVRKEIHKKVTKFTHGVVSKENLEKFEQTFKKKTISNYFRLLNLYSCFEKCDKKLIDATTIDNLLNSHSQMSENDKCKPRDYCSTVICQCFKLRRQKCQMQGACNDKFVNKMHQFYSRYKETPLTVEHGDLASGFCSEALAKCQEWFGCFTNCKTKNNN